jgi:hypothetical protein
MKREAIDVHVEIPTPPITAETAEQWEAAWHTRAEAAGAVGSYILKNPKTNTWDMVACFYDLKLMGDFAKFWQSKGMRQRSIPVVPKRESS